MKKRILVLLLAICLVASLVPMLAHAAEGDAVAEVGGVQYESLQAAIDAADGKTVKLIDSVDMGSANVKIPAGAAVVLDLNGYTISGICDSGEAYLIQVQNTADLTIQDTSANATGKITYASGNSNVGFAIDVKGDLILNSGTIEQTGSWSIGFAVDIRPNAWGVAYTEGTSFTMNGGKIISSDGAVRVDSNSSNVYEPLGVTFAMNGGEIEAVYDAIFVQHRYANDLYVKVNGGTLSSAFAPIRIYGNVVSDVNIEITDGTFNYTGAAGASGWVIENVLKGTADNVAAADIVISGGTFSGAIPEEFCAEGYAPVDNGNGTYGVAEAKTYVAEVNGEKFESLQAAIDAAQNGETVKLLDNINVGTNMAKVKGKQITLDLNGYNVTGNGYRVIMVDLTAGGNVANANDVLGKLTLTGNGTVENTGTKGGDSYAVYVGGCSELVVETGATVKSANGYAVFLAPMGTGRVSTLIVDGGTVTGRYAVSGNGLLSETSTVVNVISGTISGTEVAIYQPQPGVVNISGGTVNGGTDAAIAMRRGTLTVTDGTITGLVDILGDYTAVSAAFNGGDLSGATLKYAVGNTVTKAESVELAAPADYKWVNGVLTAKVYVATVDGEKFESLQAALNAGGNIVLLDNIALDAPIVVNGTVTLDLAGFAITYDSTVMGEAMITNNGNLTINDSVGTGEINYNYHGANDASYGKGNYTISNAGTLTVNGGYITIANLSSHAKYPIDNNSTTGDAILVINGGHLYNYNTSAIRQFCNSTTNKNSVTINGGKIEGYCAIWVQNPGSKTVNGDLTINGGEIRSTAKAWVNGSAELQDVGSCVYFTIAANGGAWSEASFVTIAGGIFNENVYLAEEAPAAINIGEGATFNGYLELPKTYVAEVGGVQYESLQAAIDAAGENGIITLLDNITVASDLADAAKGLYNIAADKKIIIDLNGKTIDVTDNSTGNFIVFYNYGELTIQNGTVNLTSTNNRGWNAQSTILLNRGGVMVIESGTYKHLGGTDMAIAVDNSGNSFGDAYMTVKGGLIDSSYIGIRMRMADPTLNGNPGNGLVYLTVEGGTVKGVKRGIWGQITNASADELGTLTVTGGTVEGGTNSINMSTDTNANISVSISKNANIVGEMKGDAADFAVSGGTFSVAVPEDFCATGFVPVDNGDGTYGVKAGNFVAKIGSNYYATLKAAYDAAIDGDIIVLHKNSVGDGFVITKDITIDFGIYTYTVKVNVEEGTAAMKITGDVTFTGNGGGLYVLLANRNSFDTLILNEGTLTTDTVVLYGQYLYEGTESWVVYNNTEDAVANFGAGTSVVTSVKGVGNAINTAGTFTKADVDVAAPAGYCWNAGVLSAHIAGEVAVENEVAASCTKTGSYDKVTYCANCGVEMSRETVTTDMVAHDFSAEVIDSKYLKAAATINSAAEYYNSCAVCGLSSKGQVGEDTFVAGQPLTEYVASIGETNYETLKDAYDVAVNGDTIVLHKNSVGDGFEIAKDITINFGEYYYSVKTNAEDTAAMKITGNVTFTGNGGGLYVLVANRDKFDTLILNEGTLTTDNVVLYGQYLYEGTESWVVYNNVGTATVTFNTGTRVVTSVKGTGHAINAAGTFKKADDVSVAAPAGYCWKAGVLVEKNATVDASVASVRLNEDQYFLTLKDALDAAANGDTITLLKNIVSDGLTINKDVTIDFGEYYYSVKKNAEDTAAMKITGNVIFTGNGGGLYILVANRTKVDTLILNEGTLTTENVVLYGQYMYEGTESWVVYNVNGGEVTFGAGTDVVTSVKGVSHATN